MWSNRNTNSLLVKLQTGTALLEQSVNFLESQTFFPRNLAIIQLVIYAYEYVHTKFCTWILREALFVIAKTWKQPFNLSVGECINKQWCIHTIKYYIALKRHKLSRHKEPLMHIVKWNKTIGKATCHMIPPQLHSGKGNYEDSSKISSCWGLWKGAGRDK